MIQVNWGENVMISKIDNFSDNLIKAYNLVGNILNGDKYEED